MRSTTINDCYIIDIDKHDQDKGSISIVENGNNVTFDIKRIYYLYDIPDGESRGGHAHKRLHQLIVAASGSFDVIIDDGEHKRIISLNQPYKGLLVMPGIWNKLENFSSGSVCLVLASMIYNEDDYIRKYNYFKKYKDNSDCTHSNF